MRISLYNLSKRWKAKLFILCGVIILVRLQEKLKLITLGSERVKRKYGPSPFPLPLQPCIATCVQQPTPAWHIATRHTLCVADALRDTSLYGWLTAWRRKPLQLNTWGKSPGAARGRSSWCELLGRSSLPCDNCASKTSGKRKKPGS